MCIYANGKFRRWIKRGGMEGDDPDMVETRSFLKTSLEKSRDLSRALDKTGPRLQQIHENLPSLRAAIRPISARDRAAAEIIKGHVGRAVGPAAAVLGVYNAVRALEQVLSSGDPGSDLRGYLAAVNRYEEGLKFLADSCRLVIRWLEDTIVELFVLRDEAAATAEEEETSGDGGGEGEDEPWWLSNLNKSVRILRELAARKEQARLDGGLLGVALEKLEAEMRRLLAENYSGGRASVPATSSSVVIKKLEAILHRDIVVVEG